MTTAKQIRTSFICYLCAALALITADARAQQQQQIFLGTKRHLRNTGDREWSSFSREADADLRLNFSGTKPFSAYTLQVTQSDVKQTWRVRVNDAVIGQLVQDEKKLTTYFDIPASILNETENVLTIRSDDKDADDIVVDDIRLQPGTWAGLMSAVIDIEMVGDNGFPIAARATIINDKRSLQTLVCEPVTNVAVRPGCVYTTGPVSVHVPPGSYVLYANRGFEYGVDSVVLKVGQGDHIKHRFVIRREVDTKGWIASDTHVHTFTHSHHGDATTRERVLTLAGEGIDMPVATDHNKYVNLQSSLDSLARDGIRVDMTPVVGDEVTTKVGHFNVFSIREGEKIADHRGENWQQVGESIRAVAPAEVVILNHARDVHNDFRPFDPSRHVSSVGMDRDGWILPANAMEVINSGSQQSDFMQLFRDWFGMLNGGYNLTPIGSSDSHDVNRYIVGQGRTYIRGEDEITGSIDTGAAMRSMLQGKVLVSCGLLASIRVNNAYGPGELAKGGRKIDVAVEVSGPAWSNAESVALYMNGVKVKTESISRTKGKPIREQFHWRISAPSHDVFLVAIAQGRSGDIPFWPIAKPYQPTVPDWVPRMYAATGAVWVDVDANNKAESAASYAQRLLSENEDIARLLKKLSGYDEAVVCQVAALLWRSGKELTSAEVKSAVDRSDDHVKRGFAIVTAEVEQIKR